MQSQQMKIHDTTPTMKIIMITAITVTVIMIIITTMIITIIMIMRS